MTRCSWSPGFSRETTVRTFRTERHGKPKHVQEDHNSNDVVGLTSKSMASRTIIGSSVMLWVLTRLGIRGRQRGKIHCRGPHPLERGHQNTPLTLTALPTDTVTVTDPTPRCLASPSHSLGSRPSYGCVASVWCGSILASNAS